jgi:hypothetical protein
VNFESISIGARTINGSKWDINNPTLSLPSTQVQEWSITGAVNHPFHLHIYHVQALSDDGDFEAGEYYDVVAAKMDVRFDLNTTTSSPYEGMTILHCHILSHEDRGAMTWVDVDGGTGPPTFPANNDLAKPYTAYYTLGGIQQPPNAPTNLSTSGMTSSSIVLNWDDNANDEDGFNIERSLDGTNFNFLTSVGTDVETYIDSNLTSSTTYFYQVIAYNIVGSSLSSNIASATTQSSGGGPLVHVDNINVSRVALNGSRFRSVATVTIHDNLGAPVSGATVDGSFTGPNSTNESGTTDISGQISFNSKSVKNPVGEWCFEVTDVNLPGGNYNASANAMTKACESGPVFRSTSWAYTSAYNDSRLLSVYPNPLQNSTRISFQVHQQSDVNIEIYNLLGERVTVISNRSYEAGKHFIEWDSSTFARGTYFLQLKIAGKMFDAKRLVLIR